MTNILRLYDEHWESIYDNYEEEEEEREANRIFRETFGAEDLDDLLWGY